MGSGHDGSGEVRWGDIGSDGVRWELMGPTLARWDPVGSNGIGLGRIRQGFDELR